MDEACRAAAWHRCRLRAAGAFGDFGRREEMSEAILPEPEVTVPSNPDAEQFYEGAYARIIRSMAVLAAIFTIATEIRFGWRAAGGFLAGCGLATINFLWLKRTVMTLASKILEPKDEKSPKKANLRYVLRYALLAAIAYVIFKS